MQIFKNKLQAQIDTLELSNTELQAKLDDVTLELNSYTDQSELIASLQSELDDLKEANTEQVESIEDLTEQVEVAEQVEVDVALEVSKQTAEIVSLLGVEGVEIIEEGESMTIVEQYSKLEGDARREFFAANKAAILGSAQLNLFTK